MSGDSSHASLGVIELANRPLTFVGNLGNPRSYPYPVLYDTAQGAYVSRIVSGDPELESAYTDAAKRLAARGASAIIGTCGFAVLYQRAVAAQVDIPVLLSPLTLLPLVFTTTPPGSCILVLTYDSRRLDACFLRAADVDPASPRMRFAGIEGTASWRALAAPQPEVEPARLRTDVLAALDTALGAAGQVGAVLLECSAFCPLRDVIRARSGVPVFDFLFAADSMMSAAHGRAAANPPSNAALTAAASWREGSDAFQAEFVR